MKLFTVSGLLVVGSKQNTHTSYYPEETHQSYIRKNDIRIKSLITPDIIHIDEPNEIEVEIRRGTIKTYLLTISWIIISIFFHSHK